MQSLDIINLTNNIKGLYMNIHEIISKLSNEEKSQLISLLQSQISSEEESLTELRFSNGLFCPRCGCMENITKFGFKNNHQRFRCKNCGRVFNEITNSALMGTKKDISIWKKYLECMFNNFSIRKSAQICNINQTTAFVWRHKILDALSIKIEKEVKLGGIIEVDETFFNISYKGSRKLPREAHHRGTRASKRGISNEQICVPCAVDRNKNSYGKISNFGRITTQSLKKMFNGKIEKNSIICTDSNSAYRKFSEDNAFEHIEIESGKHKCGIYHINHINSYHSKLKSFLRRFNGVSSKYLNNYIVWSGNMIGGIGELVQVICEMRYRTFSDRDVIPILK